MSPENDRFTEIAADWDHSHRYSPAPRHRRLYILNILDRIKFSDCLDAGCAQPYLLQDISDRYHVPGYGCDLSTQVVALNKERFPALHFEAINLAQDRWPGGKRFDLVVSSEVIEHIPDWQAALKNIAAMSKKYLLITVPSGNLRPIDRMLGHHRHYKGPELLVEIEKNGFKPLEVSRHGFPIHSLYKRAINLVAPEKLYASFSGGKKYSLFQRVFSHSLYALFFLNYFFKSGDQIFVLAERQQSA
jgi:hypothetical protein